MTTLDDFGAGTDEDPPRIKKTTAVRGGRSPDGSKRHVGHYGPIPERGCRGFVTKRDSDAHKIHAISPDGAYAVSDDVLERLASIGVGRILVHETDTGDVYEFRFQEFADGPSVPAAIGAESDPQTFRRPENAYAVWEDHGDDVYIPRGEDIQP